MLADQWRRQLSLIERQPYRQQADNCCEQQQLADEQRGVIAEPMKLLPRVAARIRVDSSEPLWQLEIESRLDQRVAQPALLVAPLIRRKQGELPTLSCFSRERQRNLHWLPVDILVPEERILLRGAGGSAIASRQAPVASFSTKPILLL